MDKSKEIKKVPVYLFNEENPQGETFSFYGGKSSDEYKKMIEEGWVDTPAKLKLPKEMNTGVLENEAANADPQMLIGILEGYGFVVLTQEQLETQANKMAAAAIDMENFSDSDIIEEAERRGLKKADEDTEHDAGVNLNLLDSGAGSADYIDAREQKEEELLLERFKKDPESLNKDEHIVLGRSLELVLRSNWSEKVMIEKITEKLG